jgi:hypothetical protein
MKEKVWVVEDPDEKPQRATTRVIRDETPVRQEKSPATAYTLSTLFWGAGQLYNRQTTKGLIFLVLMLLVATSIVLTSLFFNPLVQFLRSRRIPLADAFFAAELLLFCLLIFWKYNAGNAYHTAVSARRTPFTGAQNKACPFFSSLLVPGWGQFQNAQPIKGSIYAGFSIFSLFSILTIPSVLLVWPYLIASDTRFIIEAIFALTILFAPLIPFIWIIGSFDALRVSTDELKKEPLLNRIKYANNRRRNQGWVRGVFPRIKSTILLVLFLTLLIVIAYYYYFPKNFYSSQVTAVQVYLRNLGMTFVPDLIDRLREALVLPGR